MYKVVYDIGSAGYQIWRFPAFGLIFVAIGAIAVATVIHRNSLPFPGWSGQPRKSKVFSYSFLAFGVFWTVATTSLTYQQYSKLANATRNGTAKVVEGQVTDFTPMPYGGHALESFCVSGACFEYSDYVITTGFNNTSSHGGPIRAGLPVRVTYVGGTIVKLEIGPTPSQ